MYKWEIPPRMQKKSLLGKVSATDAICFACVVVVCFILVTILKIVGVILAALLGMSGVLLFLMTDQFNESFRKKLTRSLQFNKKQKVFYSYRTMFTGPYAQTDESR